MPIIRVDMKSGKSPQYRQKVSEVIYETAVRVGNVPKDDNFQVLGEHSAENFIYSKNYLGVQRTDDLIIIQIVFNEGRTQDLKKSLFAALAEELNKAVGVRKEDVLINLIEVNKENWSFGNGIAQYVV